MLGVSLAGGYLCSSFALDKHMKINLLVICTFFLLGAACGQNQPTAKAPAGAGPSAAPVAISATAPASSVSEAPNKVPASKLYEIFAARADTVLHQPGYRLSWQVHLDTLRPLTHLTPPDPDRYFAGDTSRGYQGYYTVAIRDSLGRNLGGHTFTKADFYSAVGPELAISSGVELPKLLGYSAPLGGLVFTVVFAAPGTDWYGEAVLVLAPSGQVRYLGPGAGSDGPEIAVALAADGRTLLTGNGIKHASQPLLPLARAGAELRGARLLNDTLALLIDEPGRSRAHANAEPSFDATPAQRRQPNAFVRDVRTGRDVSRFRYDGFFYVLGYRVPLQLIASTQTAYLLDAEKGLYVLPLHQPAAGRWLPFATMPRAAGSPTASEISFELSAEPQGYRFIVDTTQLYKVRYQIVMQ